MSPVLPGKQPTWTRERPPAGVEVLTHGPSCRTCGSGGIDAEMIRTWQRVTRSEEPDEFGRYLIQPHHEWCPVWTGETPELPCPRCGAPVEEYESSPGYNLAVPDALAPGGVGHLVGNAEEVLGHASAVFASGKPRRAPSLDRVTVNPCGHTLEGVDANRLIVRAADLRRARWLTECYATLAAVQQLLDAADAAGHGALTEAYRKAVRGRTRDVSGLLAALRILHPQQDTTTGEST